MCSCMNPFGDQVILVDLAEAIFSKSAQIALLALVQVRYEVCTFFFFFDACEDHLGANYVLFRIYEVLEHVLVGPNDTGVLVRLRVGKPVASTRLTAHDAPKRRTLLGVTPFLRCVTLSALRFEELGAFLHLTIWHGDIRFWDRHRATNHDEELAGCEWAW